MIHISNLRELNVSREEIADFCRQWQVAELALFGSVLRDDFRPDSDIDLLVSFAANVTKRFDELQDMKEQLSAMFGRRVDLVRKDLVANSKNYIRRTRILDHTEPIYVA